MELLVHLSVTVRDNVVVEEGRGIVVGVDHRYFLQRCPAPVLLDTERIPPAISEPRFPRHDPTPTA
ncbi:MAG: hypothetical protein RBT60_13480 [Candidatus Krumholzibacteria bacterium]|nr:hypothetical protein [Candidatus Krumholzibacteria bacterium]